MGSCFSGLVPIHRQSRSLEICNERVRAERPAVDSWCTAPPLVYSTAAMSLRSAAQKGRFVCLPFDSFSHSLSLSLLALTPSRYRQKLGLLSTAHAGRRQFVDTCILAGLRASRRKAK